MPKNSRSVNPYAKDLVEIHKNKYQPVSSRLRMGHNADPEVIARLKQSVIAASDSDILHDDGKFLIVKVWFDIKPEFGGGHFEGIAESDRGAKSIEGDSPLEVCETSAWGRAFTVAGILTDGDIGGKYEGDRIDIRGKDYLPVEARLRMAHEGDDDIRERLKQSIFKSIKFTVVHVDDARVSIKAEIEIRDDLGGAHYSGLAESNRRSTKAIEGRKPVEVAATSALGRACGYAGIVLGKAEFINSAEDIRRGLAKEEERTGVRSNDGVTDDQIKTIRELATQKGISGERLDAHAIKAHGNTIERLSQTQANQVINKLKAEPDPGEKGKPKSQRIS